MENNSVVIGEYIMGLIEPITGIKKVTYGDTDRILYSVEACIIPYSKDTELAYSGRGVNITISYYVILYFAYEKYPEYNQLECDKLAHTVEAVLNADATLGGRVISSYVTKSESGAIIKDTMVRANRLTFTVETRDRLPM